MRLRLTIWLLILPLFVFTQTPVSGIVNSYYKVIEVVIPKSCVRVGNAAGLGLNDQVLIIQMKGASISTANSAAFGSVSNLQNAGNYEIGTVCSIRGDSVFLFKQLAQSYTVSDLV